MIDGAERDRTGEVTVAGGKSWPQGVKWTDRATIITRNGGLTFFLFIGVGD